MSASPKLTHYLPQPPGACRMHLLETLALNKLRRWMVGWVDGGGGCFGCHRVGEGLLWKMPPEGLLSGENPEKSHSDRPEDSQMEGKPSRQPRSPCSNQDDGNETGVEQGRGSPFAATVWRGEIKVRGPASCPSPDKQLPPPAALPPLQPPCHAGAVKRRWGGPDLPACIWLTGDCEGALRAHVTINNPCWERWTEGVYMLPPPLCVFLFSYREGGGGDLSPNLTTHACSGCSGVCFEKIHMHRVQACMHAWRASFGGVILDVINCRSAFGGEWGGDVGNKQRNERW